MRKRRAVTRAVAFDAVLTSIPDPNQDLAYERAILEARKDPALRGEVASAFLEEDAAAALESFRASEHWARVRRLLRDERVEPESRILDFGGGRGLLSAALSLDGHRTTLCEPNPSSVCGTGAAGDLRAAAGVDFEIVNGSVEQLDPDAFDAVVCRAVIHHVEPLVPILREVHRVLRPNCPLVCSDEPTIRRPKDLERLRRENVFVKYGVDENALRARDYDRALCEAGFADVRIAFPVDWSGYRRFIRPTTNAAVAVTLYLRYRARSTIRPKPGEVRSIVAHKHP